MSVLHDKTMKALKGVKLFENTTIQCYTHELSDEEFKELFRDIAPACGEMGVELFQHKMADSWTGGSTIALLSDTEELGKAKSLALVAVSLKKAEDLSDGFPEPWDEEEAEIVQRAKDRYKADIDNPELAKIVTFYIELSRAESPERPPGFAVEAMDQGANVFPVLDRECVVDSFENIVDGFENLKEQVTGDDFDKALEPFRRVLSCLPPVNFMEVEVPEIHPSRLLENSDDEEDLGLN